MRLSVFTLLAVAVAASTVQAAAPNAQDAKLGSLNADAKTADYSGVPDLSVEVERDVAELDGEERTIGTQPAFLLHAHLLRNSQSPEELERVRALGLRLLSQGVSLDKITGGDEQLKTLLSEDYGLVKVTASSPHSSVKGINANAHSRSLQRRRAARRDLEIEAETSEISTPDEKLLDEDEDEEDYEPDNAPQEAKERKTERSSDAHPDDDEDGEVANAEVQIGREV